LFKKELQRKLEQIFQLQKTTFDTPSDSFEQDTLFIQISNTKQRISDKQIHFRVSGNLTVYSRKSAFPFGFFNTKLDQVKDSALRKGFYLVNGDNEIDSAASFVDVHERRTGFVFTYSAQYDPNQGQMTSLTF
jgi:hypothetical protein